MPTPTDDRRDLLTVIASMRAKPGQEDRLRTSTRTCRPRTWSSSPVGWRNCSTSRA